MANAQWTLEARATSEHPLLRERTQRLVEDRPNDPYLAKMLGVTLYEAIQNAPPSPKLEALLLRRDARQQKADRTARAAAAKRRQSAGRRKQPKPTRPARHP